MAHMDLGAVVSVTASMQMAVIRSLVSATAWKGGQVCDVTYRVRRTAGGGTATCPALVRMGRLVHRKMGAVTVPLASEAQLVSALACLAGMVKNVPGFASAPTFQPVTMWTARAIAFLGGLVVTARNPVSQDSGE